MLPILVNSKIKLVFRKKKKKKTLTGLVHAYTNFNFRAKV